jgi:hypothetical protein
MMIPGNPPASVRLRSLTLTMSNPGGRVIEKKTLD